MVNIQRQQLEERIADLEQQSLQSKHTAAEQDHLVSSSGFMPALTIVVQLREASQREARLQRESVEHAEQLSLLQQELVKEQQESQQKQARPSHCQSWVRCEDCRVRGDCLSGCRWNSNSSEVTQQQMSGQVKE